MLLVTISCDKGSFLSSINSPDNKISLNFTLDNVKPFYSINKEDKIISGTTKYSIEMCASIKQNNLYAVQFHPEKSAADGLKIYKNFINIVGSY